MNQLLNQKEERIPIVKKWDKEKIGIYIATLTLIFMFWQSWRDLHKDISDVRERIAVIETILKIEKAQK